MRPVLIFFGTGGLYDRGDDVAFEIGLSIGLRRCCGIRAVEHDLSPVLECLTP